MGICWFINGSCLFGSSAWRLKWQGMDKLFSQLALVDINQDVIRNIVSIRDSQDLFDDLTDNPEEWKLAQDVERDVKPPIYCSSIPLIHRPFEEAEWADAINYPFKKWQTSRFSDGSFGIWSGSASIETTVYESVYHWYQGLLRDAGFENEPLVIGERKIYWVACNAALLDFRRVIKGFPNLVHSSDYSYAQSVGARIHREGHPGLLTLSVRHPNGENFVVFNPRVLSNPRMNCQLTYRLEGRQILIEKKPGETWMEISV